MTNAPTEQGRADEPGAVVTLPAPTGPHPVGVTELHLVDEARSDPWDEAVGVREVMVSLHYPARSVEGCPRAPHMRPEAAALYTFVEPFIHPQLPGEGVDWAATLTHSHSAAPALPGPRPVLLYSPGGGDPRTQGTSLAEELASHGYVVAAVDHPGDAGEVEFPSAREGRDTVRVTALRGDPAADTDLFRTLIETRIADLRFVLDQLERLAAGRNPDAASRPLPEGLAPSLDLTRVGAWGHSAGGTAVAQTLYDDARLTAAANLEGYLDHPDGTPFDVAEKGAGKPLLLIGTDGFRDPRIDRSWGVAVARADAARAAHATDAAHAAHASVTRAELTGAHHWAFTDYAATAPQLQAAGLMTPEARASFVGSADPAVTVPAVRAHLRSFFDTHL
ncbi:alpha/beta hydrolase family protein [Streptomyces sp. PU-14G]|uniref:alpha/beta hydrolase family protein n=1 Tax=Streptomyces sp. PU-14G TaxID=2800808 RepID=UPI0034DF80D9